MYITKNNLNWRNHPIIQETCNHTQIIILPTHASFPPNTWIEEIAKKVKEANMKPVRSPLKQFFFGKKKTISKYEQLYDKSSKKINWEVLKNNDNPPLDCLLNKYKNILTNPEGIAQETYTQ